MRLFAVLLLLFTPAVAQAADAPGVGRQRGSYHFAEAGRDMPYRLYVPTTWDGKARLPVVVFLHGGGADENTNVDANDGQLEKLAEAHGYLLISPLGYSPTGAYGSPMRLTSPYGDQAAQARLRAAADADPARIRELRLSEKDVLNVLDRVLAQYNADPARVFLAGHSMGSGGTWYLGNKYAERWAAIAPLSGPFVEEARDPFAKLKGKPIYYTEGTDTPSLAPSRALADRLKTDGFNITYREFDADHGGMVPLAIPGVFDFFDAHRR